MYIYTYIHSYIFQIHNMYIYIHNINILYTYVYTKTIQQNLELVGQWIGKPASSKYVCFAWRILAHSVGRSTIQLCVTMSVTGVLTCSGPCPTEPCKGMGETLGTPTIGWLILTIDMSIYGFFRSWILTHIHLWNQIYFGEFGLLYPVLTSIYVLLGLSN